MFHTHIIIYPLKHLTCTQTSLKSICYCTTTTTKGFDGGQRQWFVMEIYDQQTGMLQANVSSKLPIFTVGGLDAGRLLKILIYSANVKGNSETIFLEAFTLKAAEKQTGKV